jgi:hypothetical protein
MNSTFVHPDQARRYFELRLPNFHWNGHAQVSTHCPFHSDATASFSVNLDEGVWTCHSGCGSGGIIDFESRFSNCDHETAKTNVGTLLGVTLGPQPEAIYTYRDALGRTVFRKLRYPPTSKHKFVCQRPEGKNGWSDGLKDIADKPLYNLPELVSASYAICVEGEKDADRVAALNLAQYRNDKLRVATTCNFDGAGHWPAAYNPYFTGKIVVILPDNDPPGQQHALDCATGIFPFAAGVKIVNPAGLPEHGDISDYIDAGHTAEDLIRQIAETPPWTPSTEVSRFKSIAEIVAKGSGTANWIFSRHVEQTALTLLSAKIKTGKSSLAMSASKAVINGYQFLGQPVIRGPVVMVTEMAGSAFIAAVERAGLESCEGLRVLQPHDTFGLIWSQIVAAAVEECRRVSAVLLIIDTLNWFAGLTGDDENSAGKMMEAMRPLQGATGKGWGILCVGHERKSGGDVADALRGSSAAGGVADILMSLRKPEGNHHSETIRKISSISRFPQTPSELVIDWTAGNEYVVLGDSDSISFDRCTQHIMQVLPVFAESAKTVVVLAEETGEKRSTVQRVLKELKAIRVGSGERGDPFRYWLRPGGPE